MTLNSYTTQIAMQNAIVNLSGSCICKMKAKLEGMTLSIGEILDYSIWINPESNREEILLLLSGCPLITISKENFEKHFDNLSK